MNLKEKYTYLIFPLNEDGQSIFTSYLTELGYNQLENLDQIKSLYAHALRDYLSNQINVSQFSSICYEISLSQKNLDILRQNQTLKRFIEDCADLTWLSLGDNFLSYKNQLEKFFQQLLLE